MVEYDKIPFAEWLEGCVKYVAEEKPQWIGVVVVKEDGGTSTAYTTDDNTYIALAQAALNADFMMNLIKLNRDTVVEMLTEEDEDESEYEEE